MVNKNLLEIAMRLAQKLGANPSKFLGTKTNVNFMGSGPKDGMLFQQNINPEAYLKIGKQKVLPMVEDSMGYFSGGKLNEIQANKLIDNMNVMLDLEKKMPQLPGTGGLGALKETPEIASSLPGPEAGYKFAKPMSTREKFIQASKDGTLNRQKAVDLSREAGMTDKLTPAPKQKGNKYSKAFAAASGLDMQGKPLTQVYKNIAKLKAQDTGKQTAGGELLLNVFQGQKFIPRDVKGFLQSGNQGDSIKIVEKYFGPKVADLVPLGATAEEMSIFTQRVLNNLVDAKGFRPGDPKFNRLTADFVEKTFASGGRVGFSNGGLAKILEL